MIVYYILVIYLLFAVTIAVMYDSYRNISIAKGDPLKINTDEDNDLTCTDKCRKFCQKLIPFIRWFFAWIPREQLDTIVNRCVGVQNAADSDSEDEEQKAREEEEKK